jgi:hypothetical protein
MAAGEPTTPSKASYVELQAQCCGRDTVAMASGIRVFTGFGFAVAAIEDILCPGG